jgi:hypothetical protein
MSSRSLFSCLLFLISTCFLNLAAAQISAAAPSGPLTCHKEVCAQPTSSCQVLESQSCLHGGGPPRCPAILNVADGTSCSDGKTCTTSDVCGAGVCGGTPVVCSTPGDICTEATGCVTPCGPAGCVISAVGGFLNPTLTVPAGALSSPVIITMFDQAGDPNDASVFHVYSFAPAGTQFAIPATVDLPGPPLTAGEVAVIEVSDDGTTWTPIATTVNGSRVTGPIAHFSKCRTRAAVQGPGGGNLIIVDAVDYQDLFPVKADGLVIPPAGEAGACYSGDLSGLCFRMRNATSVDFTSVCPVPTPTPPPGGCHQLHVIAWQCYTALRNFPAPFDPSNPNAYEGQHCDNTGILIPCTEAIYNMDQFLVPVGGVLAAGKDLWVDFNFVGPTARQSSNGVSPYSCFGSSFIGFDLIFREPTPTDPQGGIRSAKDGPFVQVSPTVRLTWEQLVAPQPANYPSLRFTPAGTAIRHWLMDERF